MSPGARALGVACAVLSVVGSGCAASAGDEVAATQSDELRLTRKVFGLGVDAPTAAASPHFAQLKAGWRTAPGGFSLTSARIVFNIDTVDPSGHQLFGDGSAGDPLNRLRTWVNGVTAAGLVPLVAIEPAQTCVQTGPQNCSQFKGAVRIDDGTYRYRFHQLVALFPEVQAWGPVNEPDILAPFEPPAPHGAVQQVVDFYVDAADVLAECRQGGGCQHVSLFAGEFARISEGYWHHYAGRLRAAVHAGRLAQFPRVWGLHPYGDTTNGHTHEVDAYDRFLSHVEHQMGFAPDTLRVWLTESGTLLEHGNVSRHKCADDGRAKAQYDGARAVYRFTRRSRVDRVYWWQFQQATQCWCGAWDSAMADWNGTPRPSFCALAKLPIADCTGDVYARDCGGPGRAGCGSCQ